MSAIDAAIRFFGTQAELAARLDVARPVVNEWVKGKRPIPPTRAALIERMTKGEVTCERLLTSERWVRVSDPGWPHPKGRPCLDVAAGLGQVGRGKVA
jgi:DNA-binding transcriptional regulator YdaS (Cro superfamily)